MAGLVIIAAAILLSVLGANIRPDSSKDANTQQVSLSNKGINFRVPVLKIARHDEQDAKSGFFSGLFFGGIAAAYTELPLHSYKVSGDSIKGYLYGGAAEIAGSPFGMHLMEAMYVLEPGTIHAEGEIYSAVSISGKEIKVTRSELLEKVESECIYEKRFILGTDKFGRDMLSRLMAGTIVSLSVGLISVCISLLLGVSLGALAGYFGGTIDDIITWVINVVWSIPTLLLVIAITFAMGKGFVQVFIAVGLTMWVEVARVVRGQVIGLRNVEFIEAARALGYTSGRVISVHILPNIMGPVIVISAANFASAILLEAGLSFLGIGAQIPMASWGQMIKDHYAYITTGMAYLAILPGLCIMVLVLAFMLVGSGLRDAFDTRLNA